MQQKDYFSLNSKKFNNNLKKTKKIFNEFKIELKNYQIPMLQSLEKNYQFNFSSELVRKYSKYENIIIVGMGGSVLGAKSIYSFFKNKVKKKVFFLITWI